MNYTHDPKKLAQNVAKHGVWFDIAEGFDWSTLSFASIAAMTTQNLGSSQ